MTGAEAFGCAGHALSIKPAQTNLSEGDAKLLAEWVLGGAK